VRKKPRILVVDDNEVIRAVFQRILNDKYDVVTANDGEDALSKVKESRFETIFLDISLPGLDGVETLSQIKEFSPMAEVMMITGYMNPRKIEEALLKGAAGNLFKPFDRDQIVNITDKNEGFIDKLPVREGDTTFLIDTTDIFFLSANHNFVEVHTCGKKIQTRITLNSLEKRLSNQGFFRTHRSFIVNLKKVNKIKHERGGILLVMNDENKSTVSVSRSKITQIKKLLGCDHQRFARSG